MWSCKVTWSKTSLTLWVGIKVSYHPGRFGSHNHSGSRDAMDFPHDLARPRDQSVIWLYGFEPLKLRPRHRHCGSGDMMVLVCHVILQVHVMKRSCDFIGRRPWRYVTILQSLAAIALRIVKLK